MGNDAYEKAFLMLFEYSITKDDKLLDKIGQNKIALKMLFKCYNVCLNLALTTNIFEQGEQYGQKH